MDITVDVDTGGTFTDGFATRGEEMATVKVDTTPHDLTEGFVACLEEIADHFDLSLGEMLEQTSVIRYSTTFGTNSIIQRSGPRLGLIVSSGFERTLYGSEERSTAYDWLLEEGLVSGIAAEVDTKGQVQGSVDEDEVRKAVIELLENGARGLVVAIKGSHQNPTVEDAVRDVVRRDFPRHFLGALPTLVSAGISKSRDDQLRLQTALLSAYIHLGLARHLYKAEEEIRRRGYTKPLLIVHANGAVARVAKSIAVHTYSSGPAAGLVGSRELGRALGVESSLTLDIGGTSTDIGAIDDVMSEVGEPVSIEGLTVDVPLMVTESLGGGGGSIARVENGVIKVGPQSAGASPGPICYGLGAELPTVTDANLLLGFLNPETFLGGRRKLDVEKARKGIKEYISDPLGISEDEAAWQIRKAVDQIIADGLTEYSRTHDLRPTALFAYGGGGPNHVSSVADLLGIQDAYCFPMSPVFSAYGSSRMDVCHLYETAVSIGSDDPAVNLEDITNSMREEADRDMLGEGFDPASVSHKIEAGIGLRDDLTKNVYIEIDDGGMITPSSAIEAAQPVFNSAGIAGDGLGSFMWESVRLTAVAATPHAPLSGGRVETEVDVLPKDSSTTRKVWNGTGFSDTRVFEFSTLEPGELIIGPAMIDCEFTTIFVSDVREAWVDSTRNVVMKLTNATKREDGND